MYLPAMLCCRSVTMRGTGPPKSLVRLDTRDLPVEAKVHREIWGKLVSAYDGDTITVAMDLGAGYVAVKCRMQGYDSPEMKPPKGASNREQTKRDAAAAREYLLGLLGGEDATHMFFSKGRDKYGRLLVNCLVEGRWVSDLMIDAGHGYAYDGGTKKILI